MKNLIYLFIGALLVFSCTTPDPCKDKVCGTSGTCTEGICICDSGYEQDSIGACNVEWSAKFIKASAVAQDTCVGVNVGTFNYNMGIARKSATALTTTNFAGYGAANIVEIDVTSSTNLSINYTDVANRVFTGTGSISSGVITLDVIVDFPSNPVSDTCTTTITL